MARTGRKVRPKRAPTWAWVAALGVAVAAAFLVGSALEEDAPENGSVVGSSRSFTPVTGVPDVHGLAVSPADPSVLFVATHHGLLRAVDGADWARVGDVRDDLMGFSAHPTDPDVFWSSGHPIEGGNMGVRKTTDGGFTWRTLALAGEADFHAMTVSPADPDVLWGSWAGRVYRSDDAGASWNVVNGDGLRILSLTASPGDASALYAGAAEGVLKSEDAGASWSLLEGAPAATAVYADPTDERVLYASGRGGAWKSGDAGATWQTLDLHADGGLVGYFAVAPSDPDVVYAATYQAGIYRSGDSGATWTTVLAPKS